MFLEIVFECAAVHTLVDIAWQFIGSEPKSTKNGLLELATVKFTVQGDLQSARKSAISGFIVETLSLDGDRQIIFLAGLVQIFFLH